MAGAGKPPMAMNPDDMVIAEAIRRGRMSPDQAAQLGFSHVAQMAVTGRLAPGGPAMSDTKTDQEALEAARSDARNKLHAAQLSEQFIQQNRQADTGGLWGVQAPFNGPSLGDAMASMTGNEAWPTMKSIVNQAAPAQRVPGSGSSTDTDVKMFKESLPNVGYPYDANVQIAQRRQNESDQAAARAAFMDTWYANNGTLLGADPAFNSFWQKRLSGDPAANNTMGASGAPPRRMKFDPRTGGFQ